MGKRKSKTAKAAKRNIRVQRANIKTVCKNKAGKKRKFKNKKPGRKQAPKPIAINDADTLKVTVRHFFGNIINTLIRKIVDPRIEVMCTYSMTHLVWLAILMFIFRLKSRNQLLMERETEIFHSNLLDISDSNETDVAHPDTVNYLLKKLLPNKIEKIKIKLVKHLIKKRVLDGERLLGDFCIAADGTGVFSTSSRHCKNCLRTEHSEGSVSYSHKMLEAKIVSERGFALSIGSEPIENINGFYRKQDCELKAFYRLEKKIKNNFKRTAICMLLDGLYACREVFNICKRNHWNFIIVLKPKKIPSLYKAASSKIKKSPDNKVIINGKHEEQEISWMNGLEYGKFKLNVVFCKTTKKEGKKKTTSLNSWVTNLPLRRENVNEIVNKGGRQRWKIENKGFKEQKCDDYELEHLYGEHPNAWKNYYQILQIAHAITQLMVLGDSCKKLQEFSKANDDKQLICSFAKYYKSVRNFIRRLCESFRNSPFSEATYELPAKIQIRFSSG